MRSLAVISVLLFHLDEKLLPGGFVGVDVFFVISGYLITSIIAAECQTDSFSFRRFYQRRVSRIFPAAFAVLITVLILASFLYTAQDFAGTGAIAIAAALSIANMKLMVEGNYFEILPDAQPLLHYWSLSVEEQFYIIFPLIVYLAFRWRISRRLFIAFLTTLALVSFIAGLMLTATKPTWAFYLLPTRAWELLAGCILAIVTTRPQTSTPNATPSAPSPDTTPSKTAAVLANVGLVLLVVSFFVIHEDNFFPGWIAALPVIGTILLIGRSPNAHAWSHRLLSRPSLVHIGKASYSLYLWHWPIYCFVDYTLLSQTHTQRTVLKIILTLVCSFASYYFFEKPVRSWLNQPRKQTLGFIGFAGGVIALVAIGFVIRTNFYIDAKPDTISRGGITINANVNKPVVVLMGDSNATMYGLLMKKLANQYNFRLHVISVDALNPFPGSPLYRDSMQFIENEKPQAVVFAAAWAQCLEHDKTLLSTALTQIRQHAQHIVMLTQPPMLPQHATRQGIRDNGMNPIYEDDFIANLRDITNRLLLTLHDDQIHVLDIESHFMNPDGTIRFLDTNRKLLFQDQGHLSGLGTELIRPQLAQTLRTILASHTIAQSANPAPKH